MTQNKVMKLWTAIVTAFLALCTTLGLITTTAAAVPQSGTMRNGNATVTAPTMPHGMWPHARSLPPTMKQRIRAEAHGSSPSCRHRPTMDDTATDDTATDPAATDPAALRAPETPTEPDVPLRH